MKAPMPPGEPGDPRDWRALVVADGHALRDALAVRLRSAGFAVRALDPLDGATDPERVLAHGAAVLEIADAPARPRARRYVVGPLELDLVGHFARVEGVPVDLTALEMRLLVNLVEHHGQVRSYQDLLNEVWHYSARVSSRTHATHVRRLRSKLGVAGPLLETVRGLGYRISARYSVSVAFAAGRAAPADGGAPDDG